MYHTAMYPHMVVQVGQPGHFHPHILDLTQRPNRVCPNGSLPHSPYDHGGGNPMEFLSLFGIEGTRNGLTYNGRCASNNGSSIGGNCNAVGNNKSINIGNASWRDRNASTMNHMNHMGPPPVHMGPRPLSNCPLTKGTWASKASTNNSRSGSRENSAGEAYNSDSGFSSRSPTPSSQQVSPSSSKSTSSNDEDSHSAGGEPAVIKVRGTENKSNKRQEPNIHHNYYQPYFPHNGHFVGQFNIHQNGQNFHHNPQHHHHPHHQHSTQAYHHHNHHMTHTQNSHVQRRSESLTSLNQQSPTNGYQRKRIHHSGRHSPPTFRNPSRGRRMSAGAPMRSPLPAPSMTSFSAPERFLQRSHLMYVTNKPAQLLTGGEWDELSGDMWEKFASNQQTEEMYRNKMELWKLLYFNIKKNFPRYGLFLVGSTISGFGSNKSDMDMCLLVRHSEMDQRNEAVCYLEQVLKCLRLCSFIVNADLIQAKVPILKFKDANHNLEVDLNCNNAVGIRNTHLLYCYSQMDWRVRPLVLVVKLWAAQQGINDAKNMTISSYSLVLMVINFLQCGVKPSVLPCLHQVYPGKFHPHGDPHSIDLREELQPVTSENTQPLGQLLLSFLEYYAQFDYTQDAVSVRTASRLPIEECRHARSYKNDPHQWKYLCIEEPFDLTNTAHSVYDPEAFDKIKETFANSFQTLKETRNLESIFAQQDKD